MSINCVMNRGIAVGSTDEGLVARWWFIHKNIIPIGKASEIKEDKEIFSH